MSNTPDTARQDGLNLLQSLTQKAQGELNVVFATDQFAYALAALKLAQSNSIKAQQDAPAALTTADLREIWRKDQELVGAAINEANVQGEAHIDAVLTLFDLK